MIKRRRVGEAKAEFLPFILPSRVPPIDAQIGARHEAASVAEQEDGGTAVVLGAAQLAEHVLAGPLDLAVGKFVEQRPHHICDNVSGGDGVDANPVLAPLGRQVPAQLDNGCLRRVVDTIRRLVYF